MSERHPTRQVRVGSVAIGGGAPIAVQSMTTTDTRDPEATLAQIQRLADAGCEIVRVAVPAHDALPGFTTICERSPLPVVADIHFDHRLAIRAAALGAAKIRINPGTIGELARVDEVIEAAGSAGIPIRIGVNAGSLEPRIRDADLPLARKLAESAIAFASHFEERGFHDIVVSAKASDVPTTIEAYRLLARSLPYPLHLGVTEAGTLIAGTVKSAVGIGVLLHDGIGDTLRVSLTADPVREVEVAWEILASLGIRRRTPEIVSCPTCGRCQIDLIPLAESVAHRLKDRPGDLKVAVMGCVVNGPGEAADADIGIAAGRGSGIIFVRGVPVRKVPADRLLEALMEEVDRLIGT